MENIFIRPITADEWDEAMRIAWDTFILFEAPEYSKEGIQNFKNFVKDPILKTLYLEGKYRVLAAFVYDTETNASLMVGIIGVRNETHISLLFVDSEYHRRGIARKLLTRMFDMTYKEFGKRAMTVNSSPYAVEFYHKIGFKDTDSEKETDGIKYTPMVINF